LSEAMVDRDDDDDDDGDCSSVDRRLSECCPLSSDGAGTSGGAAGTESVGGLVFGGELAMVLSSRRAPRSTSSQPSNSALD